MKNEQQEQLPIENLEELKEEVKLTGFHNYFDRQIEEKVKTGKADFQLNRSIDVGGERINYLLHFRVDKERKKAYFNAMDASLKVPELGEERRHTFPCYLRITAKEAFNLLKYGEATAVQKKLFNKKGEKYLSYITLDLNGNKDERGNYPLKQYHENYYKDFPFDLEKSLDNLPVRVKELDNPVTRNFILSSLKRGNRHQVTMYNNGVVETAYLMINAKAGKIDIRNSNMQLIRVNAKEQNNESTQTQQPGNNRKEIKKKSGTKQKTKRSSRKKSRMKL